MPQYVNAAGQTVYVDESGRSFVATPSGWVPVAGLQPTPPPTMSQVPGASLPIMPQVADLRASAHEHAARKGHAPAEGITREAIYPTAPFRYAGAAKIIRQYSATLLSTESDYTVNVEAVRAVRFDFPSTIVELTAAAFNTAAGNALPIGVGPRDCFLISIRSANGDNYVINPRLASTVAGTGELPGEVGDSGWVFDAGNAMIVGITPLLASLRIDVTIKVLEQRGKQNFAG